MNPRLNLSGDEHISRLPGEVSRFVMYLHYEEKFGVTAE